MMTVKRRFTIETSAPTESTWVYLEAYEVVQKLREYEIKTSTAAIYKIQKNGSRVFHSPLKNPLSATVFCTQ